VPYTRIYTPTYTYSILYYRRPYTQDKKGRIYTFKCIRLCTAISTPYMASGLYTFFILALKALKALRKLTEPTDRPFYDGVTVRSAIRCCAAFRKHNDLTSDPSTSVVHHTLIIPEVL
jgi:hypothetical protein